MKVSLDTKLKKEKRLKRYQDRINKAYLDSAKLELLSIKLYKKILKRFAKDEIKLRALKSLIDEDIKHLAILNNILSKPLKHINLIKLLWHYFLNFLFGFTFSLRVLERVEDKLKNKYKHFRDEVFNTIIQEENKHTLLLEEILDTRKLEYVSMVVLGLNDAIVEMSAAIAGYSLSLGSNKLIFLISLITGIAASLSMAASSFLSSRQTPNLNPFKSMALTGLTYLLVVVLLTLPFLLFINYSSLYPLISMGVIVILVIFIFNYYISVAKKQSLAKNFFTMALVALLVAGLSFLIGFIINKFLPIK